MLFLSFAATAVLSSRCHWRLQSREDGREAFLSQLEAEFEDEVVEEEAPEKEEYSASMIDAFRTRMEAELEEGVSSKPMDAARDAGLAVKAALATDAKIILVDLRVATLDPRDEMFDRDAATDWIDALKEAAGIDDVDFAPSDVKQFRAELTETPKVVVNPLFSVPPIEMDDALTAYALWPLSANGLVRICITRRYPWPWAMFLDQPGIGYVRAHSFPGDDPPSPPRIDDALKAAIDRLSQFGSLD